MIRKKTKNPVVRLTVVLAAAVLMALNIKIFVNNGNLIPGGATGLTILIQGIFLKFFQIQIPYTVVNILLNSIPVYIGFRYIGKKFTAYSLVMILVSSILVDLIPPFVLTSDILLISIFGGIINGTAISMCLAVDATSGGTDFISIYLSQKSGKDSFNLILIFNVIILAIAGFLFGWDKALYSIIFQFASTQILHLLYRTYQQYTLLIVTEKPEEISKKIYEICRHGATIMRGKGSYLGNDRFVLYSVIDAPDARNIEQEIHKIDQQAFVNCMVTKEVEGKFYHSPKD